MTVFVKEENAAPTRVSLALALLRVVVGFVFAVHGYQKLFQMGLGGVEGFFTTIGAPAPGVTAPLVSLTEFVGGIALILGFGVPVVGALLAAVMGGAFFLVHWPNGFSVSDGGYEFVLTLGTAALALAIAGGGAYALGPRLFGNRRSGDV